MASVVTNHRQLVLAVGIAGLVMLLWRVLPLLLPELALTQRPPEYTNPVAEAELPVSHVSLPIVFPLDVIERHLTTELDASLARKREDNDFKAWRSGPLQVLANGPVVQIVLPLSFRSHAGPDTKGSLIVHTRLTADIAPDWRPRVRVKSTFDWVKKPRFKVLLFKVRVSGVVGRSISKKLNELDTDLRKRIESALTLKPRAESWWQGLHQADLLTAEPPVWLLVAPEAMYFEPVGGDGRNLKLMLGIRARLSTFVAREPAPLTPTTLPLLQRATAEDEGFVLRLPVMADYQGLVEKMREALVGRVIRLDQGAIIPTDFTFYTSGHNLVVGIDFRSDAPGFWMDTRGTVYFTGEPQFDPETRILRIKNFQFTRRLNNPLVSTATWVLHDSLREQMQNRLVWDLGDRLQAAAHKLSAQINQPLGDELQLSGAVEHLNLTSIQCRAEGIQIGLEVRGRLSVGLTQPRL